MALCKPVEVKTIFLGEILHRTLVETTQTQIPLASLFFPTCQVRVVRFCSLPDLNHDHPRQVFPANLNPRQVFPAGPQPPERTPKDMPDRMPDRTSDRMPDRMSEYAR